MTRLALQEGHMTNSKVNGVRDICRRLKSAREGFERTEKNLNRLLGYQHGWIMRACKFATSLIPVRRVQRWVNELSDPLSGGESALRGYANEIQAGLIGLKRETEKLWQDKIQVMETLSKVEEEQWDPEQLFDFIVQEAEINGLPIDLEVVALMHEHQGRLSEEERRVLAERMKEGIAGYSAAVDALVKYVARVADETFKLFAKVVPQYVAFAKFRPVVSELQNIGLATTGASEAVFASRDLLIGSLHASHEAFMVAADAAEAMERFKIAGPEMVKMLQDAEGKLAGRLKMLHGPRVLVKELLAASIPKPEVA